MSNGVNLPREVGATTFGGIDMSDESVAGGLSRRGLLKRGALVGAAAVWTVPLVQAVSMTPAHADSPSGSSGGGGGGNSVPTQPAPTPTTSTPAPAGGGVEPASVTTANTANAASGTAAGSTESGSLAFTGTALPVSTTLGVGAAALAVGAGALAASAAVKRHQAASQTDA